MIATTEDMELLRKNLKTLRFIFGLRHSDLAKYLGLSEKTVKRIESGRSRMTKPYYYAIWECFHDRELELGTEVASITFYGRMWKLFTEKGTDLSEEKRRMIESIIWLFDTRSVKKLGYKMIQAKLYDLLKEPFCKPLYAIK